MWMDRFKLQLCMQLLNSVGQELALVKVDGEFFLFHYYFPRMFLCARVCACVRVCACTCVSVRVRACVCMCAHVLTLPFF